MVTEYLFCTGCCPPGRRAQAQAAPEAILSTSDEADPLMPCWDHSASSWPASPDPAGLPSGPLLSPFSSKEVSVYPWYQGQLAI